MPGKNLANLQKWLKNLKTYIQLKEDLSEKVFSKMKNPDILLRFLLSLDDKIYELMPRYATKVHKTLYQSKSWKVA